MPEPRLLLGLLCLLLRLLERRLLLRPCRLLLVLRRVAVLLLLLRLRTLPASDGARLWDLRRRRRCSDDCELLRLLWLLRLLGVSMLWAASMAASSATAAVRVRGGEGSLCCDHLDAPTLDARYCRLRCAEARFLARSSLTLRTAAL